MTGVVGCFHFGSVGLPKGIVTRLSHDLLVAYFFMDILEKRLKALLSCDPNIRVAISVRAHANLFYSFTSFSTDFKEQRNFVSFRKLKSKYNIVKIGMMNGNQLISPSFQCYSH